MVVDLMKKLLISPKSIRLVWKAAKINNTRMKMGGGGLVLDLVYIHICNVLVLICIKFSLICFHIIYYIIFIVAENVSICWCQSRFIVIFLIDDKSSVNKIHLDLGLYILNSRFFVSFSKMYHHLKRFVYVVYLSYQDLLNI